MARARLILDTRKGSKSAINGLYPVALRIFHKKPRIVRLSFRTSVLGWDDKNSRLLKSTYVNSNLDCDVINNEIYEKLHIAKSLINKLDNEIEKIDVGTLVKIIKKEWYDKKYYKVKEEFKNEITITEFGKVLIKRKNKANKPATAKWYKDAIDAFVKVNDGVDLALGEITIAFLKDFEAEHRSRNNTTNTISSYIRGISAIYNSAVSEDVFIPEKNPFHHYKTPTTKLVKKKALPKESILNFRNIEYKFESTIWHTKNYLLFMFNARGMNFIDIAKLRLKNIVGEYIFYGRSKTNDPLSVKITSEMKKILDLYLEGKSPNDFIFPIGNDGSAEQFKKYRSDRRLVNKQMKRIAKGCRDRRKDDYLLPKAFLFYYS